MKTSFTRQHFAQIWLLAIFFFMMSYTSVQAQLIVTPGTPPEDMVNMLTGGGVSVSNITLNCPDGAYGTFNGLASNIGIETGIMLATGPLSIAVGPNTSGSSGQDNFGAGYDMLTDIAGFPTFNACILEFDIIPEGDILSFNYVFGSEEYNEFVCSNYNDVFAFFVTGLNPAGPDYSNTNVAIIPGTNIPVAINSVNNGTVGTSGTAGGCISLDYAEFYVDNAGGISVQYDGFTVVLSATVEVVPFETYHFILAIADAGDGGWDSGVFLEAGSFVSLPDLSISDPTTAVEGCVDATVTVFINEAQASDTGVPLTYGGTATFGVDYLPLPSVVVIPAGETSASFTVETLADGFPDPFETIIITLTETGASTTVTILEPDLPEVNLGPDGLFCAGDVIQLNAAYPSATAYLWQDGSTGSTYIVSAPGTYSVTVTSECGEATDEITFTTEPELTVSLGDDITTCSPVVLDATTPGALAYEWSTGATTPMITASTGGNYSVTVSNNCSEAIDLITITIGGGISVNLGGNQNLCIEDLTVLNAFNEDATSYLWSDGSTEPTLTITETGVYSVTVTGECGVGTDEVCIILESCDSACDNMFITQIVDCTTTLPETYQVYASVAGGTPPYTITGDYNGVMDEDNLVFLFGPLPFNTFYLIDITDANGCVRSILGKPVCSTLPITLTEFDGRTQETSNLLWWNTSSEVYNAFFTLERSDDGLNFSPITTIAGAGNSSTARSYEFNDKNPLNGANYYRLHQTDFDGQTQIVGTVLLNRKGINTATPIIVLPTVTKNEITVLVNNHNESSAKLQLYDTAGRLLAFKSVQPGTQSISFELRDYPAGLYLLRYHSENEIYSVKVVKQ